MSLQKRRIQASGERGGSLLLFTFLTFLVVVPVIGLAIDGSIVLWQKARLASSVDAAAYAAGRSLSVGSTVPTAQAAANATAITYFNANFQPGTIGTTASVTPTVPPPNNGLWTISVDATAQVQLYFLRLLGFSRSSLAAHAQVSRRNVNIIVVLDRSASLVIYNAGACSSLISSAQNFTNLFVAGQDNLGLVTFQTTANLDFPPGLDFKTRPVIAFPSVYGMSQLIGKLQCSGYTNTVAALKLAYDEIENINQPGALNVIVFFSDGKPDAITADFKVKSADSRDAVPYNFTYGSSPASTCTNPGTKMTGVLVAMDEFPDPTGSTLGVIPAPNCPTCGDPINSAGSGPYGLLPAPISRSASPGCTFSNPSATATFGSGAWCSGAACDVRTDIESIPPTDSNANSTNTTYRPLTIANYGLFPSGAYTANMVRPDTPAGVVNASLNAAFEQVKTIRSTAASKPKPIIYTIGLGSYIDTGFMQDVANDPSAPNPDPSSPQGQYIYAPTASQLSSAFQQIASQVLRISQ